MCVGHDLLAVEGTGFAHWFEKMAKKLVAPGLDWGNLPAIALGQRPRTVLCLVEMAAKIDECAKCRPRWLWRASSPKPFLTFLGKDEMATDPASHWDKSCWGVHCVCLFWFYWGACQTIIMVGEALAPPRKYTRVQLAWYSHMSNKGEHSYQRRGHSQRHPYNANLWRLASGGDHRDYAT